MERGRDGGTNAGVPTPSGVASSHAESPTQQLYCHERLDDGGAEHTDDTEIAEYQPYQFADGYDSTSGESVTSAIEINPDEEDRWASNVVELDSQQLDEDRIYETMRRIYSVHHSHHCHQECHSKQRATYTYKLVERPFRRWRFSKNAGNKKLAQQGILITLLQD